MARRRNNFIRPLSPRSVGDSVRRANHGSETETDLFFGRNGGTPSIPIEYAHGTARAPLKEIASCFRARQRDVRAENATAMRQVAFFGRVCEPLVTLRWQVCPPEALMVHRALSHLLKKWVEKEPAPIKSGLFAPVPQKAVEIAPDVWDFAPIEALRFWIGPQGERICVQFSEGMDNDFGECVFIEFIVPHSLHNFVRKLWPRIVAWTRKNHFLRGQKFSASFKFLEIGKDDVWESLILAGFIKQTLAANTLHLLRKCDAYRTAGVPLRRGVLLHGPPGTGKTMIGRALAQSCGCTFILATPAMIGNGRDVRMLFELARRLAPTILFFEDLDLVGADRHARVSSEVLGELLAGLDGLDSSEGVITIATTNDLITIEPALKDRPNRFDVVLEIPALDGPERREFLTRWLASHPDASIDLDPLDEATRGFTGAQMQEVCRAAIIAAVERMDDAAQAAKPAITQEDFVSAVDRLKKRTKPVTGFHAER